MTGCNAPSGCGRWVMIPVEELHSTVVEPKSPLAVSLKNVLFATDFSATSEAALPYATAICRHFGGTLHTAHVLADSSLLMMTGGVDYVSMGTRSEERRVGKEC